MCGQARKEPGRDRVQLADMPELQRPQERAQRRRCPHPGKQPAHPAVPQHRHVRDRVRTRHHPRDQRGYLQPGRVARPASHRQVTVSQLDQTRSFGDRHGRDQSGMRHKIRVVEHHRPDRERLSRPGARCRDCSRSVSPDRSPNPACVSPRTGLSTEAAVMRGAAPRGSGCVASVAIPGDRHGGEVEQRDPVRRQWFPPAARAGELSAEVLPRPVVQRHQPPRDPPPHEVGEGWKVCLLTACRK